MDVVAVDGRPLPLAQRLPGQGIKPNAAQGTARDRARRHRPAAIREVDMPDDGGQRSNAHPDDAYGTAGSQAAGSFGVGVRVTSWT